MPPPHAPRSPPARLRTRGPGSGLSSARPCDEREGPFAELPLSLAGIPADPPRTTIPAAASSRSPDARSLRSPPPGGARRRCRRPLPARARSRGGAGARAVGAPGGSGVERTAVQLGRPGRHAERPGAIGGIRQRRGEEWPEVGDVEPGSLAILDRRLQVVDEHLRAVLRPSVRKPRDPLGRTAVLLGAGRARDLSVGGVADEGVEEDVLRAPSTAERRSRLTNSRRSSDRKRSSSSQAEEDESAARASVQNTFPSTEASWRRDFSAAPSPSIRAATIPCSVSGTSDVGSPAAISRAYSSAKSGIPPRAAAAPPASRRAAPNGRAARREDGPCRRRRAVRATQ